MDQAYMFWFFGTIQKVKKWGTWAWPKFDEEVERAPSELDRPMAPASPRQSLWEHMASFLTGQKNAVSVLKNSIHLIYHTSSPYILTLSLPTWTCYITWPVYDIQTISKPSWSPDLEACDAALGIMVPTQAARRMLQLGDLSHGTTTSSWPKVLRFL